MGKQLEVGNVDDTGALRSVFRRNLEQPVIVSRLRHPNVGRR